MSQATGLRFAAPKWKEILGDKVAGRCVGKERITILVSANYYKQRLEFYKGSDYNIKPLLLRWETLSANQIKCIMGIKDTDTQLYVSTMLNLLKRYQREKKMPSAPVFFKEVRVACNIAGQGGPLVQRLALLESLIAESDINKKIKDTGSDLYAQCAPGRLVIADMTDPLLSKSDVNGVFQVFNCFLSLIFYLTYSTAECRLSSRDQCQLHVAAGRYPLLSSPLIHCDSNLQLGIVAKSLVYPTSCIRVLHTPLLLFYSSLPFFF